MKKINNQTNKNILEQQFLKEQSRLKDIVYDEIELLRKRQATDIKCSIEMLKDAIFVIDRGFDDIVSGISENNIIEREHKLDLFKESLIYSIYGR